MMMLPETATVLSTHPGVRDAVVCRLRCDEREEVVAFVAADENYLDEALGRRNAEKSQIRLWRKTYELTQYAKAAAASPLAFNTLGWNSSYTRQPIPAEEMSEWVQTTVDRVLTLAPREVLEIGCGTGLLLFRIAPASRRYVGIDFAPAVLARVREQLAQMQGLADRVELVERAADDFGDFEEDTFDTVIVNSVAQYFPNLAYLRGVMEKAIRVIKPGGHLFVGDKRNLPLLEAHALSVEAAWAAPDTPAGELRDRVQRRMRQEQELVPSPSCFLSAGRQNSKLSRVEIRPRRGLRDNEMTRFRYDAILRIGTRESPAAGVDFLAPPDGGWSLEGLRSRLGGARSSAVGIAHIGNARVERDVRLLERLATADLGEPLAELSKHLDPGDTRGIHPEEIHRLAAETGHEAVLSWASCRRDGSYDAAFLPARGSARGAFPAISWPQPDPADFVYLANTPGQAGILEKLMGELVAHCRTKLPAEMVPGSLYIVDSLPGNSEGSVDCDALFRATRVGGASHASARSLV